MKFTNILLILPLLAPHINPASAFSLSDLNPFGENNGPVSLRRTVRFRVTEFVWVNLFAIRALTLPENIFISQDPTDADACHKYGISLAMEDRTDESLHWFEKVRKKERRSWRKR